MEVARGIADSLRSTSRTDYSGRCTNAGIRQISPLSPRELTVVFRRKASEMPSAEQALPGRDEQMLVPERHFLVGTPLRGPWPEGSKLAMFGMGCFWGTE